MWLFELSLESKISKTLRTIYLMDRNPILNFVTIMRNGRPGCWFVHVFRRFRGRKVVLGRFIHE